MIISEYVEGSSNNKYLEIYNGTGSSIDLSDYDVRIYANGSSTPTSTINLSGTLNNGDVYVIEHSSESLGVTADLSTGSLSFNGDDAVELYNSSTTSMVDLFGNIGCDPGSMWSSASNQTQDKTLTRNSDECTGVTSDDVTSCPFPTLEDEWTESAQDDVSGLGSHTESCCVLAAEPSTHASGMSFSSVQNDQITVSWTDGDGANRIVVAKEGGAVSGTPTDKNTYSANANFGDGGTIAANEYVVYNDNGSSVTVTGLKCNTTYYFKVFEYNGASSCTENYYTSGTPLSGNQSTGATTEPTTQASGASTSGVGENTVTVNWSRGDGDSCLVTVKIDGDADDPVDGNDYNADATYEAGSSLSDGYVVYKGTGTSVNIDGLQSNQTYYFEIFEYNGANSSGCTDYLVSSPASTSVTTSSGVLINEIYVDTDVNDGAPNPELGEWVELYNTGTSSVDISCWVICDGDFCVTIPDGTSISGEGFYTIGSDNGSGCGGCDFPGQTYDLDWGTSGCATGSTIGTFTNGGEQLILFDDAAAIKDAVIWGGGQDLPTGMNTGNVCGCSDQSVTLPNTMSTYEDMGTTTNATSFERKYDGSGLWQTENSPTEGVSNGADPLPVELLSFDAAYNGQKVDLFWTTAMEAHNDFFTIERSSDGKTIEAIEKVRGAGNSNETINYFTQDPNPLKGISYYRLKQTDFDGKTSYSKWVSVKITEETDRLSIEKAYRFNDQLVVKTGNMRHTALKVVIYDIAGRQIQHQKISPGISNIFTISVPDLPKGVYLLKLSDEEQVAVQKFIY